MQYSAGAERQWLRSIRKPPIASGSQARPLRSYRTKLQQSPPHLTKRCGGQIGKRNDMKGLIFCWCGREDSKVDQQKLCKHWTFGQATGVLCTRPLYSLIRTLEKNHRSLAVALGRAVACPSGFQREAKDRKRQRVRKTHFVQSFLRERQGPGYSP
jgi:hypothetical protein